MNGPDGKPLVLFDNVFPATPSGKIELQSETWRSDGATPRCMPAWRERAGDLSADADLSRLRQADHLDTGCSRSRKAPQLLMHPRDAAARGLTPGAR